MARATSALGRYSQWTGKDQDAVCSGICVLASFLGDPEARAVVLATPGVGPTVASAFAQHADSHHIAFYYVTMSS